MIKQVISLMTATVLFAGTAPFSTFADAEECTVTFLDLDGKPYFTMSIPKGGQMDKQAVQQLDTQNLRKQIDGHTQMWFSSWTDIPDNITEDVIVRPLTVTGTISMEKQPNKHKYYSLNSEISSDGLVVDIILETQTGIDEKGNFIVNKEVVDISSTCTVEPKTTAEAFKSGDKATVKIFPINSKSPIGNYEISYIEGIADVDGDGVISGSDATLVLIEYTNLSDTPEYKLNESVMKYGDMDNDGIITGSDATLLLCYYTMLSSDNEYNLDKFFEENNILNRI